uniref:Uncharacterized protein n=1 Tax=Tanacetum cinerariifolium TaxID=118510 RepID=A0A6L2LKH5_TANCI|nr:hypothetical protein [Tanacetum cinerariifolium]
MIVYSILIEIKIDIGEIIFNDFIIRHSDKLRKKYVAYPRFISYMLKRLLNSDYTQDTILGSTASVLIKPDTIPAIQSCGDFETFMEDSYDNLKDFSDEEIFKVEEEMETDMPHALEEPSQPPPSTDKLTLSNENYSPPPESSQPEQSLPEATHLEEP